MTTLEQRQQFWDRDAKDWTSHQQFAAQKTNLIDCVREAIANLKPHLTSVEQTLNIGSGANQTDYLTGILKPKLNISLDISRSMLRHINTNGRLQADLEYPIPLTTRSIDFLISFYVMRYLSEQSQLNLLDEASRVLKPEGSMLIIDLPWNNYPEQLSKFYPHRIRELHGPTGFTNLTPVVRDMGGYWIGAIYALGGKDVRDRISQIKLWNHESQDRHAYENWVPRDTQAEAHGF